MWPASPINALPGLLSGCGNFAITWQLSVKQATSLTSFSSLLLWLLKSKSKKTATPQTPRKRYKQMNKRKAQPLPELPPADWEHRVLMKRKNQISRTLWVSWVTSVPGGPSTNGMWRAWQPRKKSRTCLQPLLHPVPAEGPSEAGWSPAQCTSLFIQWDWPLVLDLWW